MMYGNSQYAFFSPHTIVPSTLQLKKNVLEKLETLNEIQEYHKWIYLKYCVVSVYIREVS